MPGQSVNMKRRGAWRGLTGMLARVASVGLLSACAAHHHPPAPATPPVAAAVTPSEPVLVNDPSAPADTPLCGHAAREANAIGASIHPDITPLRSSCAANACFDPQTGTYIGADGNRHVCR
nr:BA14K family protein [Novacetimonas pomaceti]